MPCWLGKAVRQHHQERVEFRAELWEGLDVAEAAAACAACGSAEPSPECWLCGWSWLHDLREQFERELLVVDVEEEFERIAVRATAEARVERLTRWVQRCREMLDAHAVGGGRGRAVQLLADLLSADAAARSSTRGRPSWLPQVCAVLALDADHRSGRRARPGRAATAELVGCTERAVTAAWRRAERTVGWIQRTVQGGLLSFERRVAEGRSQDRAEFDVRPAHRQDVTRVRPWVAVAVAVYVELLHQVVEQLRDAQDALDALQGPGAVGWEDLARRAQLRAAVEHTTSTVTPPIDGLNIVAPPGGHKGEYFSSCLYLGLHFRREINFQAVPGTRQSREGEGATRSPARRSDGSRRVERPMTLRAAVTHRARPAWSEWAYPLARQLRAGSGWSWLAQARLPEIAAVLGTRVSPDWTVPELVAHVERHRAGRAWPDQVAAPGAYLARLLVHAAATPAEELAAEERRQEDARRAEVAARAAELRAHRAAERAAYAQREGTKTPTENRPAEAENAFAELRAKLATKKAAVLVDPGAWPEVRRAGSGSA